MDQPKDECDLLFEEARQLLDEQHHAQAIEAFTEFIALVPESEGAYGNRGLAYMNFGDDERAIQDFEMVLSLNQDDAMGHAMLGEALKNKGRHEDALQAAVTALDLDEETPEAYYVRGWLFAKAGQYSQAAEDLQRYVDLVEEPGEIADLLEACQILSRHDPVDEEGYPLSDPRDREQYLGEMGLSFDFRYNSEHEEQELFCPYAHCIRNMPRRGPDAPPVCPVTGFECPGGADQAETCRENPPAEPME